MFRAMLLSLLVSQAAWANFLPKKIAVGQLNSCALATDGRLKCWGYNSSGYLGTGNFYNYGFYPNSMGPALPEAILGTGVKAADVCLGYDHVCIVDTQGRVKCWGYNGHGSLGHGTTTETVVTMGDKLPFTNLGANFKAKAITCGYDHNCALSEKNQVKCWGKNTSGILGLGDTKTRGLASTEMGDNLPFLAVAKPVLSIVAGYDTTCLATTDGYRCWGTNSYGVLGQEDTVNRGLEPNSAGDKLPVIKLEDASTSIYPIKISSGNGFSCALFKTALDGPNRIKCWGRNGSGFLGIGNTTSRGDAAGTMGKNLPYLDLDMDDILDVQVYDASACALSVTGRVKCWGSNGNGQLGLGDDLSRGDKPETAGRNLAEVDLGLPVRALGVGESSSHVCAILINNTVKCWGNGADGVLGYENGDTIGAKPMEMGDNLPFVRLE